MISPEGVAVIGLCLNAGIFIILVFISIQYRDYLNLGNSKLKPSASDIDITETVSLKESSVSDMKGAVNVNPVNSVTESSIDTLLLSLSSDKKEKIRKLLLIDLLKDPAILKDNGEIEKGGG